MLVYQRVYIYICVCVMIYIYGNYIEGFIYIYALI